MSNKQCENVIKNFRCWYLKIALTLSGTRGLKTIMVHNDFRVPEEKNVIIQVDDNKEG